jgi:hypothetical protein
MSSTFVLVDRRIILRSFVFNLDIEFGGGVNLTKGRCDLRT